MASNLDSNKVPQKTEKKQQRPIPFQSKGFVLLKADVGTLFVFGSAPNKNLLKPMLAQLGFYRILFEFSPKVYFGLSGPSGSL